MILFPFPLPAGEDGCSRAASIFPPSRPAAHPSSFSPLLLCLSRDAAMAGPGNPILGWRRRGAALGGCRGRTLRRFSAVCAAGAAGASPLRPALCRLPLPRTWGSATWGALELGMSPDGDVGVPGAPRGTQRRNPVAPSLRPGVPGEGRVSLALGSAREGDGGCAERGPMDGCAKGRAVPSRGVGSSRGAAGQRRGSAWGPSHMSCWAVGANMWGDGPDHTPGWGWGRRDGTFQLVPESIPHAVRGEMRRGRRGKPGKASTCCGMRQISAQSSGRGLCRHSALVGHLLLVPGRLLSISKNPLSRSKPPQEPINRPPPWPGCAFPATAFPMNFCRFLPLLCCCSNVSGKVEALFCAELSFSFFFFEQG